jgi:hypothetical protein
MVGAAVPVRHQRGWSATLNGRYHRAALNTFMVVVVLHWGEHIAQAVQIWGMGWPRPKAKGLIGYAFPWLVTSEWLHYGFALVMLVALWTLRHGFTGRARRWWTIALGIQFWHHIEHFLLLMQAQTHHYLFSAKVPTSILQHYYPRVELHLFYNTIVTIPMIIAVVLHMRPNKAERAAATCSCGVHGHGHDHERVPEMAA